MAQDTTTASARAHSVAAAAERLAGAAARGIATRPVRDVIGPTDQALAYDVQQAFNAKRLAAGARIVGRKIGATSRAVQEQLGVQTPDTGVLFDDMRFADGGIVRRGRLIAPKVEAEVAFVLAEDLTDFDAGSPLDAAVTEPSRLAAANAVDYAVAALEIVDSRIADWDIAITDTIADNASSGLFVLGATRVALTDFRPADVVMTLTRNGEPASAGTGSACLGDPLIALAWLARTAARFGAPLRAGEVVLSGALGAMVSAHPGDQIAMVLSTLGRVAVSFAK
jgi:2-keto-4-pentenoate hydratase